MIGRGFLRVRCPHRDGYFAIGDDSVVEAHVGDGTWMPLRGVTAIDIRVRPNALVTANVNIELAELNASGVVILAPDGWRTRWFQLRIWFRKWLARVRAAA